MIIYKATNLINGKIYIGQTVRPLQERIGEHSRKEITVFSKAVKKYGKDNFKFEVIDTAETIEELNEKEKRWISFYNCIVPNGYNQCDGGDNTCGFHHREESKQRMSAAHKGIYDGASNPFFGKHHTEAQREKWGKTRKGLAHLTDEQVKNLRAAHFTAKVRCVETGEIFNSIKEAADKYKLKDTHITRVCKGRRKTTGGYHWEYVNI